MALHVIKLAVGADTVQDIADWQVHQVKTLKHKVPVCGTRMWPKRADAVLAGGSLYWVVKGVVAVRQKIVSIDDVIDDHGARCGLYLDPKLVRTLPQLRRAFQGWRYLEAKDAPADLTKRAGAALPEDLRRQLVELGAW
jgi:hypothetical protein